MQWRNSAEKYGAVAKTLHWLIALVIFGMIGLGLYMEDLPRGPQQYEFIQLHKSFGITLLALVVLSTVWLRVAHHFFQVPWNAWALYHSFVVQTGYAILWTVLALALMVAAHRRGLRPAWLAGAGLIAVAMIGMEMTR